MIIKSHSFYINLIFDFIIKIKKTIKMSILKAHNYINAYQKAFFITFGEPIEAILSYFRSNTFN